MSTDSVAQDQIKAFVDRILRLKAEAKAINADVREVYGEAKASGFDKTVLGKLVSYIEKRNADSNAVAEGEALFDLYLSAYYGVGTKVATHTHETEPLLTKAAGQGGDTHAEPVASQPIPEQQSPQPAASDLTALETAGQVAPIQPETANDVGEAQKVERRSPKPEDAGSIPATYASAGSSNGRTADFDSANAGSTPAPATSLSKAERMKRLRPHCQFPERCGSSGGKNHCWPCRKAAGVAA